MQASPSSLALFLKGSTEVKQKSAEMGLENELVLHENLNKHTSITLALAIALRLPHHSICVTAHTTLPSAKGMLSIWVETTSGLETV